jgi:hypothetical protein
VPARGPQRGGTPLTILGAHFAAGAADDSVRVTIGGVPCGGVRVISDTALRCEAPPGTGLAVPVAVEVGGRHGVSNAAYSYEDPNSNASMESAASSSSSSSSGGGGGGGGVSSAAVEGVSDADGNGDAAAGSTVVGGVRDGPRFHVRSCAKTDWMALKPSSRSCNPKDYSCMYKANVEEAEKYVLKSMPCQSGLPGLRTLLDKVRGAGAGGMCEQVAQKCRHLLLGCLPGPPSDPPKVFSETKVHSTADSDVYLVRLRSRLPGQTVVGLLGVPKGAPPADGKKRPAMIVVHGMGLLPEHTMCIKGHCNDYMSSAGKRLVSRGYVVFAPFIYSSEAWILRYESYSWFVGEGPFGMLVSKMQAVLDLLAARDDVDPKRMGMYGISWGGNIARATSVADERVALTVVSGNPGDAPSMMTSGLQPFKGLTTGTPLGPPGLWCECDYGVLYACSIRPRRLILEMGKRDSYLSHATDKLFPILQQFYALTGKAEDVHLSTHPGAHEMHKGDSTLKAIDRMLKDA